MPRTDENGRQLKALLDYLLDGEVEAKDIYTALGTSSSTYYRRIKEPDYPSAEELRQVADTFKLSYPDMQIRFGLMTRQELWNYVENDHVSVANAVEPGTTQTLAPAPQRTHRLPRLSESVPRQDAPPL
ncbi:MAG: XRE family transcriptional regulator [Mycobacterium sp.]|nr:XRE family transcriptional regulator [Mycobacterium sp.]